MSRELAPGELQVILDNPDKILIAAYESKIESLAEDIRCVKQLLVMGSTSSALKRLEVALATIHSLRPTTQDSESAPTVSNP